MLQPNQSLDLHVNLSNDHIISSIHTYTFIFIPIFTQKKKKKVSCVSSVADSVSWTHQPQQKMDSMDAIK